MANRYFLKQNQFPSSIQSPTSSPNNYLLNNIFLQFNEWLFFIPNLFHSLLIAISNFFHSLISLLSVIPNFFHSLLSAISNCFHSVISWLCIVPDFFHSLVSSIANLFHSLLSQLSVIPNLFHSLLSAITNLFHSLQSATTNLFHSLISSTTNLCHSLISTTANLFHSLISESTNLFHSLVTESTNLFHSLLAKFNAAYPPETRAHLLDVATPFVIGGLGVVLLLFICYKCWPALSNSITWLAKLISGFFKMLGDILCCCFKGSCKMMIAPGTNGRVIISRALFENNPAAYFSNLRLSKPLLS